MLCVFFAAVALCFAKLCNLWANLCCALSSTMYFCILHSAVRSDFHQARQYTVSVLCYELCCVESKVPHNYVYIYFSSVMWYIVESIVL